MGYTMNHLICMAVQKKGGGEGGGRAVTTDLDPPKLGPPGPIFLKNMDP